MNPDEKQPWWNVLWDTPAYWAARDAKAKLAAAKRRAREDRPRRSRRAKLARHSKRRNRA